MTEQLQARNVVIITADDLNADSMGWMGSTAGATPNIDAFAAGSDQFRNCHTVVPICQPSRAALMTGLLPHRNGAMGFGPVRENVVTLPEVMGVASYFTAAINKIAHMTPPQKFRWELALEGSGKNPGMLRQHLRQCIDAARRSGKPFFINANCTDPHGPFPGSDAESLVRDQTETALKVFDPATVTVPAFLEDLPAVRGEIARYFSAVWRLDQSFGALIAELDTAGRDDTVIVFLSDHGISMPYAKATLYRTATHTPVLLGRPGTVTPLVTDALVANIDIMATLLELLGIPLPGQCDGRSWLPLIRGADQAEQPVFTQLDSVHSGREFPSRCARTNAFAYIWNAWADGRTQFRIGAMANRESWKAMVRAGEENRTIKSRVEHFIYRQPEEFFNTAADPDERVNLIDDPQFQDQIATLKIALLDHMDKTGDPVADQFRSVAAAGAKHLLGRRRGRGMEAEQV